jgi:hypothetical protein
MPRIKPAKPSPAFLIAVVALVAALGGTAVGGVVASKLSGKEKKQVTKIARKQAKKLDKKIELKPGPKGEQGPPGATDVTLRFGPGSTMVGAGHFTSDTASCEAGEVAVGGGYFALGDATHSRVYNDGPVATTGWSVSVSNDAAATADTGVQAEVLCAAP